MNKEQVMQNVAIIAEKCQKGGLLTLQESSAVLETLQSLNDLLNIEVVAEEVVEQSKTEK